MNIEKIEVNEHYVWVDKDAEIKGDDWYYWEVTKTIQKAIKDSLDRLPKKEEGSLKIIAASPDLGLDVPTYVEWLAEQYADYKNDYVPLSFGGNYNEGYKNAFIKGYQTAEKELFTEDDVRRSFNEKDMEKSFKEGYNLALHHFKECLSKDIVGYDFLKDEPKDFYTFMKNYA